MIDYTTVTELSGELASQEQLQRMCNRYFWAGQYAKDKQLLEVACGTGQGLNYLASIAQKVTAGDICEPIVNRAKKIVRSDIEIKQLDAASLPFPEASFDLILLFEAIYYLPQPNLFLQECQRVLKPQGKLLIVTANKDLYDFSPSPFSHEYLGVLELKALLSKHNFNAVFYGDTPLNTVNLRQKILRPIKKIATQLNLIPKTMTGKLLFKKLFFGNTAVIPDFISADTLPYIKPTPLVDDQSDKQHKVIFCEATLL